MPTRKLNAQSIRNQAAQVAADRPHPRHIANGDEHKFRHDDFTSPLHQTTHKYPNSVENKASHLMSFTKGLPHNLLTGLVERPENFQKFIKAIDSGDPFDFRDTPLGVENNKGGTYCGPAELHWLSDKAKTADDGDPVVVRAWESQSAGLAFDLEGPDAQAVTMPPAPTLGSAELTAEIAEVYIQALLRDVPFHAMTAGVQCTGQDLAELHTTVDTVNQVANLTTKLSRLEWFSATAEDLKLNDIEKARQRCFDQTPSSAFRGITQGDKIGPYISQFLLAGNNDLGGNSAIQSRSLGLINYGALTVSQKVRTATERQDYMTTWKEWLDVQNGADLRGKETYSQNQPERFIYTPRDLATYVHYDALYEAYLNACLLLLGMGIPFDSGIPFQNPDNIDHQQGFAHFGGPHILSLVTEVATRALKAVRFQKYNIHRRCRPEVVAARIAKKDILKFNAPELLEMVEQLDSNGIDLLNHIREHNQNQNQGKSISDLAFNVEELLPMAFCEGSPMHPAYGAGHATVAGACVTILKAFFDDQHELDFTGESAGKAFVSIDGGDKLGIVPVLDQDCNPAKLTVEGELNKLASNISIGRDWAGVHYFSDYYESLLMGEQIAIGILEEQKLTYKENFSMTIPLFAGGTLRI